MSKLKISDFTEEMLNDICKIINDGNEVHMKREKDNLVIVEQKRKCLSKNPIRL